MALIKGFWAGIGPLLPYVILALSLRWAVQKAKKKRARSGRKEPLPLRSSRPVAIPEIRDPSPVADCAEPAGRPRLRLEDLSLADLDAGSWRTFEYAVAAILRAQGWSTVTTPAEGDRGADVVAERDGIRVVVQCKRYRRYVGVEAVQQVYAAKAWYEADQAIVAATCGYSRPARELADRIGVELWDRRELSRQLALAQSALRAA